MEPVSSNTMNKTCDNPISSNCVTYAGPSLPGITICKGASVTEVLYQMASSNEINATCYTGKWVNFTPSIPLSGSGPGYSFTISNFGFSSGTGGTPSNSPEYKWTKDGDLKVRGTFSIFVNVTIPKLYINIPIISIAKSCFPTGFTGSQYVTVCADVFPSQGAVSVAEIASIGVEYPSGVLTFSYSYSDATLSPMRLDVDFGGTCFNLA